MAWWFYVIIILVVIIVILYYSGKHRRNPPLGWVPLASPEAGWYQGTTYQLRGDATNPYGSVRLGPGRYLELKIATPLPIYWEVDVYTYPELQLVHSIPQQEKMLLGGQTYPLRRGQYMLLLRVTGEVDAMWAARCPVKLSKKDVVWPRARVPTLNDEGQRSTVESLLTRISESMPDYTLRGAAKSMDVPFIPASDHIHVEYLGFPIEAGDRLVIIGPRRGAHSEMRLTLDENQEWINVTQDVQATIREATRTGTVQVVEITYGGSPESQYLPLYAYTFTPLEGRQDV